MADTNQQSPPRQLGPAVSCRTVFMHFGIYTLYNFNFSRKICHFASEWFPFFPQQFLMSNKLETAMWLSRLFTVYCSIMFILPILGWVTCVTRVIQVLRLTTACKLSLSSPCISVFAIVCVLQTLCSSQLLPASLVSQCPYQCPSLTSKTPTLSAEQNFPGPGSSGGQLPLSVVLTHPGQLLSHHKYPFTFKGGGNERL